MMFWIIIPTMIVLVVSELYGSIWPPASPKECAIVGGVVCVFITALMVSGL